MTEPQIILNRDAQPCEIALDYGPSNRRFSIKYKHADPTLTYEGFMVLVNRIKADFKVDMTEAPPTKGDDK